MEQKKLYGVIRTGGSIGNIDSVRKSGNYVHAGSIFGELVMKDAEEEMAKTTAKINRKFLTKMDRQYYRISYRVVPMEKIHYIKDEQ